MKIFNIIKNIFKKEKTIAYIIWDGKKMNYKNLTEKQINEIKNDKECINWILVVDEKRINT